MISIFRSPPLSTERKSLANLRSKNTVRSQRTDPNTLEAVAVIKPNLGVSEDKIKDITERIRLSILTQLKDETDIAKELARQQGLREGRAEALVEARKEYAEELNRIRLISEQVLATTATKLDGLEDVVVSIAFGAVCKILGDLDGTKDAVDAIVKQALKESDGKDAVIVRLHPADLNALRENDAITVCKDRRSEVGWVADASLLHGGCVVEINGGTLDARLTSQLEVLKQALVSARNSK